MICTSHDGPALPRWTGDTVPTVAAYAARLGRRFEVLRLSHGDPFAHRLPCILGTGEPVVGYIEWDVRVAPDAPDVIELLGDADLLLPPFEHPERAAWLKDRVAGLEIPWHILGVMAGRREAFAAVHDAFPGCMAAAAGLPSAAARYEGAILLAIQRAGVELKTMPAGLHRFADRYRSAAFLHYAGDLKRKLKGKGPALAYQANQRHTDRGTSGSAGW